MSCSNNRLRTPKMFSIHITCVVPFCAKDSESQRESKPNQSASSQPNSPNLSPHHTPKRIIKKIMKAANPKMCLKPKGQEDSSPISNKFIKKINKSMQLAWKKIKHQEDDQCLWKKTILMGEKCQPLRFPGAIFYDSEGNQLSEPPKSPRFTFSLHQTFSHRFEIEM